MNGSTVGRTRQTTEYWQRKKKRSIVLIGSQRTLSRWSERGAMNRNLESYRIEAKKHIRHDSFDSQKSSSPALLALSVFSKPRRHSSKTFLAVFAIVVMTRWLSRDFPLFNMGRNSHTDIMNYKVDECSRSNSKKFARHSRIPFERFFLCVFESSPNSFVRSQVRSLQFALEFQQVGLDSGHGLFTLGCIFGEEILLASRPNFLFVVVFGLRRDGDADRILVDLIFDHVGVWEHLS